MRSGWKIGLGVALILVILIALILLFRPARQILVRQTTVYSLPLCQVRTEGAVKDLVHKDFPEYWNKFIIPLVATVITINDARCELEGYMANFGIILEDGQKTSFGIFHVHFSREGKLISSAAIVPWKQYLDRNDPKIDAAWQDFIQKVYPEEMKKPG